MKLLDIAGQRFGRLTVTGRAENSRTGIAQWSCVCTCGRECVARGTHLRQGRIQSCGCARHEYKKPDALITYNSAHYRVKRLKGKPGDHACVLCGCQAYSWALKHEAALTHPSPDGPFSGDPEDYVAMCARCHKRYDLGVL